MRKALPAVFSYTLIGALLFGAGYACRYLSVPLTVPAPETRSVAADAAPDTVRFEKGAPQLEFVRSENVLFLPEPLLEPLNGRIALDENYTARVSAPIAGRVVRIDVQPGQEVQAGSALAWIDAPDYAAAVADVRKAQNDVKQKQRSYQRSKELEDAGVIARKELESAETDLGQAGAELQRAQLRLRNITAGASHVGEDGRLALKAPIAGVVAERKVNPGAEVRPDAPDPLFVINDPTHVWVIIDLPERYLGKVKVGQRVSVEVDAYRGVDIGGTVASIGEVLDPQTRRVPVRCVVNNPQRLLKPEMYARVTPLAEERAKLARIPNSALVSQGVYSFVFVETAPGVFQKRRVTLGLQGRDDSYVKSGLADGERVVATGALLLESELASRP
jgi:cobalt-zinc-cadmium efflux system membrane fusion protein